MNCNEFLERFEVLYNSITSNQAPGLNAYEISVFANKAQDEIIKNYFTPKGNIHQDGFDNTRKRQHDFSSIVVHKTLTKIENAEKFDQRALVFSFPSDLFISLNEQVMCNYIPYTVRPISYEEYDRLMSKPYKFPPKYQVWRLITHAENSNETRMEIIGRFTSNAPVVYRIRYVKKPRPIVLANLNDLEKGLTIDGIATEQKSELPEGLHEEILQRTVELAKAAWTTTGQDNIQLAMEMGKRSE